MILELRDVTSILHFSFSRGSRLPLFSFDLIPTTLINNSSPDDAAFALIICIIGAPRAASHNCRLSSRTWQQHRFAVLVDKTAQVGYFINRLLGHSTHSSIAINYLLLSLTRQSSPFGLLAGRIQRNGDKLSSSRDHRTHRTLMCTNWLIFPSTIRLGMDLNASLYAFRCVSGIVCTPCDCWIRRARERETTDERW